MKSIEVEDADWQELYQVNVNCPYCNQYLEIIEWYDYEGTSIKKCKSCGKKFYLKTKPWKEGD